VWARQRVERERRRSAKWEVGLRRSHRECTVAKGLVVSGFGGGGTANYSDSPEGLRRLRGLWLGRGGIAASDDDGDGGGADVVDEESSQRR
jgi:hypothetical protein